MECRYFEKGECRFGRKCRYKHVKKSWLLDPPAWFIGSYRDKDFTTESTAYSFEEIRWGFYLAKLQGEEALFHFFQHWNLCIAASVSNIAAAIDALIAKSDCNDISGPLERTLDIRRPESLAQLISPVQDIPRAVYGALHSPAPFPAAPGYLEPQGDPGPSMEMEGTGHKTYGAEYSTESAAYNKLAPSSSRQMPSNTPPPKYVLGKIPRDPPNT